MFVLEPYDGGQAEKVCTACGVLKPLLAFGKHRGKRDGLASRCLECARSAVYAWREEHPEYVRTQKAAERERNHRRNAGGRVSAGSKVCSGCGVDLPAGDFHRDARSASGLGSKCKACRSAWVEDHKDLFVDYAHRRRARERSAEWEDIDRQAVYDREGGRCHICGRKVSRSNFHLEHLWPIAAGGAHVASNVAVAHPACNLRKNARVSPVQLRIG